MVSDSKNPIDVRFFLLFIPAAYASYLFHELGHWSVGEILGNRMVYSLNLVWPEGGHYAQESHALYVSMAGPAFNVIQAAIASLTIEKFRVLFAYPFAFFPLFNRIFSLLFGGSACKMKQGLQFSWARGPTWWRSSWSECCCR